MLPFEASISIKVSPTCKTGFPTVRRGKKEVFELAKETGSRAFRGALFLLLKS